MGRAGPRRPSLMDSAWNQGGKDNSPLKPGEVDNDFEEKGHQKTCFGTPPVPPGAPNTRGAKNVKFTSEPAAALKLIDTEKRGFAPPGTCLAPLQYRAGQNNNELNNVAESCGAMNPMAKPWNPQVGQFQCQGVIQQPMQQMPMQQIPQIQQGIQPVQMNQYQQPLPQPNTMPGTMPNGGTVSCFYATPIQVAAPYTTMAPLQPGVSMVMVSNPNMPSPPQGDHGPVTPMVQPPMPQQGRQQHGLAPSLGPIGPPPMAPMQQPMAPQMNMSQVHQMPQMPNQMSMPPACGPQMAHVSEPALGSSELPSKGSALHAYRACKPCAFFYQEGCSNKEQCAFCHLCEPGERKRRKKERRMARREAQEG